MTTNIAKGPWTAVPTVVSKGTWVVRDANGFNIRFFDNPHAEAHARLFAAVPEMVGVLEELVNAAIDQCAARQEPLIGGAADKKFEFIATLEKSRAALTTYRKAMGGEK